MLDADDDFSPRHAFIRAVAGQPPRGYERAVLERGELPPEFVEGVRQVESERAQRRATLETARAESGATQGGLFNAVPRLAQGVRVERKPVIAEGEFVWSYVLTSASQPEGTPCSGLVAKMVSLVDGRISVAELLDRLCEGQDETRCAQIQASAIAALEILYVDGAIEELRYS